MKNLRIKSLLLLITILVVTSCNNKKENVLKLNNLLDSIKTAETSSDPEFVKQIINEITEMELAYPDQQSLKEKKYKLQMRLKNYRDAIKTIDSLILLSPDDVDNRVIQGILYEVIGSKAKSVEVLETALEKIDYKIEHMLRNDKRKNLARDINRLYILKLLGRDTEFEYRQIRNNTDLGSYQDVYKTFLILESSTRENIINNYR